MRIAEKNKRLNQAITETDELLERAMIEYRNSLRCLEIEIEENKELGNDDAANNPVREDVKESKNRVIELKNHIKTLENMANEFI